MFPAGFGLSEGVRLCRRFRRCGKQHVKRLFQISVRNVKRRKKPHHAAMSGQGENAVLHHFRDDFILGLHGLHADHEAEARNTLNAGFSGEVLLHEIPLAGDFGEELIVETLQN